MSLIDRSSVRSSEKERNGRQQLQVPKKGTGVKEVKEKTGGERGPI